MTIKELCSILENISSNDVKLYFISRYEKDNLPKRTQAKDKYLFRVHQVDCDEELRQSLSKSSIEQLEKILEKNYEMVDYDILTDDTEHLFSYHTKNRMFSFSDVVANQLLASTIEKVVSISSIAEEGSNLWAYCVEFFDVERKCKVFTFRKILPSHVCIDSKKDKWFLAKFSTRSKKLSLIKEETVTLDYQIDCIYTEEVFYVLKKSNFELLVGLQEEYKERSKVVAANMASSGHFVGTDKLFELIEKKPSIHKKLLRVEKIGGYASLTPKGIERMHKTCKKYGDSLNIKGNKIVIETEKDLDIALRALADYYKLGVISKKAYGTFSGRELTDISKD